jgi:hypothetical protein
MWRPTSLLLGLCWVTATQAFLPPASSPIITFKTTTTTTSLQAEKKQELFKAGLLANLETEAAQLAFKKLRTVKDLGWTQPAKRRGRARPRAWAWGGSGEKAVQDKPNYDTDSPLCVEKWVSLAEFYRIVKDDTAVADTIFVALAGGGAFVERDVAEEVLAKWRPAGSRQVDEAAFIKTVQEGRQKFLLGWATFVGITGAAAIGIVFPTNPFQLALVDLIESAFHNDAKIVEQAEIIRLSTTGM